MEDDAVYRKNADMARLSLEKIKVEVAKMDKIGFELAEGIKEGDEIKEMTDLITAGTETSYNFDDIVFYSKKYGILMFQHSEVTNYGIARSLRWTDKDNKFLLELFNYSNNCRVTYIGEYKK